MKAKLVLDEMPFNCWECRFRRPTISGLGYLCVAKERVWQDSYSSCSKQKPDWCPLEPVKEKKYSDPNLCSECGTPYIGKFG